MVGAVKSLQPQDVGTVEVGHEAAKADQRCDADDEGDEKALVVVVCRADEGARHGGLVRERERVNELKRKKKKEEDELLHKQTNKQTKNHTPRRLIKKKNNNNNNNERNSSKTRLSRISISLGVNQTKTNKQKKWHQKEKEGLKGRNATLKSSLLSQKKKKSKG